MRSTRGRRHLGNARSRVRRYAGRVIFLDATWTGSAVHRPYGCNQPQHVWIGRGVGDILSWLRWWRGRLSSRRLSHGLETVI